MTRVGGAWAVLAITGLADQGMSLGEARAFRSDARHSKSIRPASHRLRNQEP